MRHLAANPQRIEQVTEMVAEPPQPGPYDTHPATADRVAAINAMDPVPHDDDKRPGRELLADPGAAERAVTGVMFVTGKAWEYIEWSEAGGPLAQSQRVAGQQILDATALPGNLGRSDMFEALRSGDLDTVGTRLGFHSGLPEDVLRPALRPYVYAGVAAALGENVDWEVDWAGPAPIRSVGHDISSLVDGLLEGGDAATEAQRRLAAIGGTDQRP